MGVMDNDATACYDRIISALSSIACQRIGMPKAAEQCHNNTLINMQFTVKTGFGISSEKYSSSPIDPLQGQGQGSGNTPSCWGAVSTPMWTALQKISPHRFFTISPDNTNETSTQGVAFVDDATTMFNDAHLPTPMSLADSISTLQQQSQHWEELLATTGGALKLQKCAWWLIHWDWSLPTPQPTVLDTIAGSMQLRDSYNGDSLPIAYRNYNDAERTLGVRLAPSGSQEAELKWLQSKAQNISTQLYCAQINRKTATIAYHSIFVPSIRYSLPCTSMTMKECDTILSKSMPSMLSIMGINRNMPKRVIYGPISHGGLGLTHFYTEQGYLQIQKATSALRKLDTGGKMLLNIINTMQLIAGIPEPLLANPHRQMHHVPHGWVKSLQIFLRTINASIQIPNAMILTLPRDNDYFLMSIFSRHISSPTKLNHIN